MKMTSSQANKLIRQLSDDLSTLESRERKTCEFLAANGEDIESVRPEYDYETTQAAIIELENKIRMVKHALSLFNATTMVPNFDMMLIYLPQLTHRKSRLDRMKNALPKVREVSSSRHSTLIDYRYANYDIDKANADYLVVCDELARAQTALDLVNSTIEFELEI